MPAKKYHHGDLRNALIKAAITLLNTQGAEALSLRAVAAAAGVSHMAPYSHFKNKKQLLQSVAGWGFSELATRMKADAQNRTAGEHPALSYGTTYITFALENPQLYRLMLGQLDTAGKRNQHDTAIHSPFSAPAPDQPNPPLPEPDANAQGPFALLQAAFAEHISDPELVNAQALGAWSLVHGMAALLIEGHFCIPPNMSIKDFLAHAVIRAP